MAWNDTTFTTTTSLARFQTYITSQSNYTADQWNSKIQLAKDKLYNDLNNRMSSASIATITNLEALNFASDYLTLALTYTQLTNTGLSEVYDIKKQFYWNQYTYQLGSALNRLTYSDSQSVTWGMFIL